jgi:hypothetical protein
LINKQITLKVTGGSFEGVLTDVGNDILVLYDGEKFYYIPLLHVNKIKHCDEENQNNTPPTKFLNDRSEKQISLRNMLINAIGIHTEIRVVGKKSLHGIITNVLSDYVVFYSPIYKYIYIPLSHLKWLTLIEQNLPPFNVQDSPAAISPLSRSFEEQLKKFEGKIVVFDMGEDKDKLGLLTKVDGTIIQLINADCNKLYLKLNHIKSIYIP